MRSNLSGALIRLFVRWVKIIYLVIYKAANWVDFAAGFYVVDRLWSIVNAL